MLERDIQVAQCVRVGVGMSLRDPDAVDLGPNDRAVGDVEILE